MTLTRQLFAGISLAFIALLIGMEAIYVSSARSNLERQLDAHANETATSLALSLGARAAALDPSLLNIMINPVFDRGHFASIEVRSAGGEPLFGRALAGADSGVPSWFAALVPLEGPSGEALISAGWKQLGRVIVRVHPGYAYRQLYETALATLLWLGLLFALALVLVRYHLSGILKPLHDIEQAALAISNRNFVSIGVAPRARELLRVTAAMNSLSAKIRDAIAQESGRAERLRKEAFEDALTGQLNRRGFEHSVAAKLEDGAEVFSGALALAALSGLEEVNRLFGMARGDEILKRLADALVVPGAHAAAVTGRWQGPTLVALIPNIAPPAALAWAEGLCSEFAARLREEGLPASVVLSIGLAHFSAPSVALAQLAPVAEGALGQALKKGGAVLASAPSGAPASSRDLRGEIESALRDGRVTLLGQKVAAVADRSILQLEILGSLSDSDGKAIPAGTFVPVANQHGLLAALDTKVAGLVLRALARLDSLPASVSLNVSMQSIGDAAFRAALGELLGANKALAKRLTFEITGYAASRSPGLTRGFAAELQRYAARVALDNFDIDRDSIAIVHELMPAYIKLSPAFTQQIGVREDLRFIIEALVRMLRPLEIPLIAQGVEDAGAIAVLAELGVSGYQGYACGRPEPLPLI